jgi:hypothetical protein
MQSHEDASVTVSVVENNGDWHCTDSDSGGVSNDSSSGDSDSGGIDSTMPKNIRRKRKYPIVSGSYSSTALTTATATAAAQHREEVASVEPFRKKTSGALWWPLPVPLIGHVVLSGGDNRLWTCVVRQFHGSTDTLIQLRALFKVAVGKEMNPTQTRLKACASRSGDIVDLYSFYLGQFETSKAGEEAVAKYMRLLNTYNWRVRIGAREPTIAAAVATTTAVSVGSTSFENDHDSQAIESLQKIKIEIASELPHEDTTSASCNFTSLALAASAGMIPVPTATFATFYSSSASTTSHTYTKPTHTYILRYSDCSRYHSCCWG